MTHFTIGLLLLCVNTCYTVYRVDESTQSDNGYGDIIADKFTQIAINIMSDAKIGFCEIELYLPGVLSLKQKRGILKSMLNKMRNKFNISNAEVGNNDTWQSATIAITCVSNSTTRLHQTIQNALKWIESNYPDAMIMKHNTEIL